MPRLLQLPQHHDRDEMPDMQRRCRRIKADIARHDLLGGKAVEPLRIGQLMNVTTCLQEAEQIGRVAGHNAAPSSITTQQRHSPSS